jgi:hypothetical protein
MAISVKNNRSQVLHTSGMRNGEVTTLVIPAGQSVECDATTPLMEQHARSRVATVTPIPDRVTHPTVTPRASAALTASNPPDTAEGSTSSLVSPTTTSGAKGGAKVKNA